MSFDDKMLPKTYKNWQERWEWIISFMVYQDLFVHEILLSMQKISSSAISTMGVNVKDSKLVLFYNPSFVNKLNDYELRYVLTHEIYHIVFLHCTIRQPIDEKDKGLNNKAADMAINCLIPQSNQRYMPKDDLKGVEAKDYGFEEKLSMEQYIQLLRENGEDGKGQDGTYGSEGEEGLGGGFDSHDGWKEDPMVKELIREKINQISRREKVWGSLPGDIQSMILSAHSHEITWQRHLKHYLGELISFMKQSTFKRPNKRFGYPYSGRKKKGIDRKLVAIDTSYSVSDSSLSIFLSEINHLAIVQPVDLILFDHKIQTKILPFNKKHVRFDFKGRGGTAFTPVFKLAEERRYRSLIILTDGQAECPPDPVFVKNVLWVIIGENNSPPKGAVGTVIKIKESLDKAA